MTSANRREARAEVESARAALVTHMAQLEEAANLPKRASKRIGAWVHQARERATEQPGAALGIALAGLAGVAGVVAVVTKIARR